MNPARTTQGTHLHFQFLPGYAQFLLDQKLEQLVDEQLRLTKEIDFPLLKHFSFMTEQQLREGSLKSTADFLRQMIANSLEEYAVLSIERWKNNLLPIITRDQIVAEDITMGNYVRKAAYTKFIPDFTPDSKTAVEIVREFDLFSQHAELLAVRTLMQIQQEEINAVNTRLLHKQAQLLEAQEIARIGNFEWDLTGQGNSNFSDQLYQIFEMEESGNLTDFLQFVHPDDREQVVASINDALLGKADYDSEYRYKRNGDEKIIWSRGVVDFDEGSPVLMRGTVMDVTARHRVLMQLRDTSAKLAAANISLQDKNRELERTNKELSSFNYVASHDLQEPLRKIVTFSDRILETESQHFTETGRDYFSRVIRSAMRMQKLISDLLSFSRTHNSDEVKEDIDLGRVLAEIRNFHLEAIAEKKLEIHIDPLPVVTGIPHQLLQLFENLIGNSVKYGKRDTTTVVRIQASEVAGKELIAHGANPKIKYTCVRVSDNGIGFDQKHAEKIFEIFQRLHGKNEYPGTGIGLSICKRIAENHQGFILALGKENEGATFHVYLPLR